MSANFEDITPYAAAKVTNIALKANGLDKEIKPQMMYTYAKKNVITVVEHEGDEKVYFDGDAFKAWLDKYIVRVQNGDVAERTDYEALANQYV